MTSRSQPHSGGATCHRPLDILLVEDLPALGESLSQFLRMRHHVVRRVTSLAAAREALAEKNFDVLIADMQLPDGACFELLNEEERVPEFIITMSGFDETKSPTPALAHGSRHHLAKPFSVEHLDALIESFVQELAHVPPIEWPRRPASGNGDSVEPDFLPSLVPGLLRETA